MMTLQHVWQGFCDGILTIAFLLFNPFVAILLLLAFVVIAICLRGSKDRFGKVAVCLAVLLAGYAVFNIATCGDHVIASSSIYGGTYNLFAVTMKKMGVDFTFISRSMGCAIDPKIVLNLSYCTTLTS